MKTDMLKSMRNVYEHMGDKLSKDLYECRIMYSISNGNEVFEKKIIRSNVKLNSTLSYIEKIAEQNEIVIFGCGVRGKEVREILMNINIKYFIDNHKKQEQLCGVTIQEYSVFKQCYENEYIVISSVRYFDEMFEQLIKDGFDENRIINLGKTLYEIKQDQYFDLEYLLPGAEETFVDVGCYDGMSSLNFARWCSESKIKRVVAFEPDRCNQVACKKNLEGSDIVYRIIGKGAWSREGSLVFNQKAAEDSHISESGQDVIEVTSLDRELANDKITFIKMDIEGAEIEAMIGSEKTIKENHPKLAISVYHRPEDIFLIPEVILNYYQGYRFYLRHYCINVAETVLYAIPE